MKLNRINFYFFKANNDKGKHECKPLFNFTPGKVENLVTQPEFSSVPSSLKNLKGRQREMYDIRLKLYHNKLLIVTGEKGIGKSAVLRNTCQNIKDRMHYKHGIVFIICKDMSTLDEFKEKLQSNFSKYASVKNALDSKKILLVLDNIDKLIDN